MISQHFSRFEFVCHCGCGFDTVDSELLELLEKIRVHFGSPLVINSAARCLKHNRSIGSRDTSQHVQGKAADIAVKGVAPEKVADYVELFQPDRGGIGRYRGFTHVDVRDSKARWSN